MVLSERKVDHHMSAVIEDTVALPEIEIDLDGLEQSVRVQTVQDLLRATADKPIARGTFFAANGATCAIGGILEELFTRPDA